MKEGFFEHILTRSIERQIDLLKGHHIVLDDFSRSEGVDILQRYLQGVLLATFRRIAESNEETAKARIIDLSQRLLAMLLESVGEDAASGSQLADTGSILKAFFRKETFHQRDMNAYMRDVYPFTGLSTSELFTGSRAGITLESELKKEMLTSDEVWWLVSFVKFEGIRLFEQTFKTLSRDNKKVKIICTVYMGATDLRAIEFLSQFPNVEIRISYELRQERLHAKSYLFLRDTGFHTAYIGSSNLSRTALTGGLEWNLKVTSQEIPHIMEKCKSTFETYWNDPQFEIYDSTKDHERLRKALKSDISAMSNGGGFFFFDIKPYPFQQEILDRIQQCRMSGQDKNLIVAATGTGKTIMAAFDFKAYLRENPSASFLFIAHREEILVQSRAVFRHVLKDPDFGHLWYSGVEPSSFKHLFATIQTLCGRIDGLQLSDDFYAYLVIDEVHHGAAPSYQKVLERFKPRQLLGLTATPERMDGFDISSLFGRTVSAEIRLPEAMNRGLLCPFQYFGITDQTDISRVSWRRGRYDIAELERIYGEDNRRVQDILWNCRKYLQDYTSPRAIGYCVSRRHAEFMSDSFKRAGLRAEYLVSGSADVDRDFRRDALRRLAKGEINYLFVVDILNEGVDIPEVDTLLFLRPTESLTVFLQQLGRGLRLSEGKSCLTVLDFVGQQRQEYSFEHKFRAMLGKTHRSIRDEIKLDFPRLPLGCSIILEQTARDTILNSIRKATRGGIRHILNAIRLFKTEYSVALDLTNFHALTEIGLEEIYGHKRLFFELVDMSGEISPQDDAPFAKFASAMSGSWLSTDSPSYFSYLIEWLQHPGNEPSNEAECRWLLMFYYDLFRQPPGCRDYVELHRIVCACIRDERLRLELLEFFRLRLQQSDAIELVDDMPHQAGLRLHGRYTRSQILVGMGESGLLEMATSREGVFRDPDGKWEILFVTLDKNEKRFNPSTMYNDYFIGEMHFHWQSQNATSENSPVGLSYIQQDSRRKEIFLFVREATSDEFGLTMPFHFCGPLKYERHSGSKPMSIVWRLLCKPPAGLFNEGRKLAVG